MRPDRILLQELRDGTAFFYLRNVNTGHPGLDHHRSRRQRRALAFEQLTLLVKESEAGRDLARDDIRALLHLLVDIVVQMPNADGRFRMTEVWYDPLRKRDRSAKAARRHRAGARGLRLFLLVASIVLLLGLRHSRWRLALVGDRHWLAALRRRPTFRPLADAGDAGRRRCGVRTAGCRAPCTVRCRFMAAARFASEREIKAAGLRSTKASCSAARTVRSCASAAPNTSCSTPRPAQAKASAMSSPTC